MEMTTQIFGRLSIYTASNEDIQDDYYCELHRGFTSGDYKQISQLITTYRLQLLAQYENNGRWLNSIMENPLLDNIEQCKLIERMLDEKLSPVNALHTGDGLNESSHEDPPLHTAIKKRNSDLVRLLLEKGADPMCKNSSDESAIYHAIMKHPLPVTIDTECQILGLLIDNGVDPNIHIFETVSALEFAINKGKHHLVQLLLERGADPNANDINGNTMLCHCIAWNTKTIVELLHKYRANMEMPNCFGQRPIQVAIKKNKPEMVELLIKLGADPNPRTSTEIPPLYTAIEGQNIQLARLLLKNGALPNAVHPSDNPIIIYAIWRKNYPLVKLLLEHNADPYALDQHKHPCYMQALEIVSPEITQLLIEYGVEELTFTATFRCKGGDLYDCPSILSYAARNGLLAIASYLLDKGIDPNTVDSEGNPLMFHVVGRQDLAMLKKFLEKGANPIVRELHNQCPLLVWAISTYVEASPQQPEIIDLLIQHGAKPANYLSEVLQDTVDVDKDILRAFMKYINNHEITHEHLILAIEKIVPTDVFKQLLDKSHPQAITKNLLWKALDTKHSQKFITLILSCVETQLAKKHLVYEAPLEMKRQSVHGAIHSLVDEYLMTSALEGHDLGSFTVMLNYAKPVNVSAKLIIAALKKNVDEKEIHTLWHGLAPGEATQEMLELLIRKFYAASLIKLFLQKTADDIDRKKILTYLLHYEVDAFDLLCEKMEKCSVSQEQFKKAAKLASKKTIPAHVPKLLWSKIIPAEREAKNDWKFENDTNATEIPALKKPVSQQKDSELGVEWVDNN